MPHTTRECSHPACEARISRSKYACTPDWFALPKEIRDRINTAWRNGGPAAILTDAYRNATAAAQAWWETRNA